MTEDKAASRKAKVREGTILPDVSCISNGPTSGYLAS